MKLSDLDLALLTVALWHYRTSLPLFPHLDQAAEFDETGVPSLDDIEDLQNRLKRENAWNSGFSLIELLIVVTILLIIATVAMPHLIRHPIHMTGWWMFAIPILFCVVAVFGLGYAVGYWQGRFNGRT